MGLFARGDVIGEIQQYASHTWTQIISKVDKAPDSANSCLIFFFI